MRGRFLYGTRSGQASRWADRVSIDYVHRCQAIAERARRRRARRHAVRLARRRNRGARQ